MTPQYRPNFRVSQMVAGARRRNSQADLLERGERVLPLLRLPASLFSIAFTGQGLFDPEFLAWLQVEGVPFDLSDDVLLQNLAALPQPTATSSPTTFFQWHHTASSEGGGASSGIGGVSCCANFSVSSLLGLKLASRLAAMVMVSPVRGLRPWRSFRSFTTKLPNPRRSTRSFAWSACAIIARTESTASSASDFFNSVWAATFSINCCFVILFKSSGSWGEACRVADRGGLPSCRSIPPAVNQAAIIPTPCQTVPSRSGSPRKKMARLG